ncbi:PIG-L deacetylase family protein [uncultured Aquimarina sp.]|uniref:PIG-L deacetylase family protein n=1 Tax=uncultured Aquimarina sp. TaxID=575652 RepID=UPI00262425CE|nr:PIG-L family deacetylase [uncultured Aquimarina sp.]
MKKVIVVSAHPDDEILGCGGTLLKHIEKGDQVDWLITTSVFTSQGFTKERVDSREEEIQKVKEELGINTIYRLDYPTMSLTDESLIKMIPKVSKIFNEAEPEIIYLLNRSDAHSDHNITFRSVMACTKSFRYPFVKRVLMYECISETEFGPTLPENVFMPTYFVDISKYRDKKNELMKIYSSELGEHPFPRSLRNMDALSTFRGATIGVEFAEAFQVLKWIDK